MSWGVLLWTGKVDSLHETEELADARTTELYELNPEWGNGVPPIGYLRVVPVAGWAPDHWDRDFPSFDYDLAREVRP